MGLEAAVIGLTVVSGLTSAYGAYSSGKAQKSAEKYNAAVARQEGEIARRQADIDIARKKKEATRYRARQEVLYAKAGVQQTGSPLEVMTDTAAEFIFDEMILDYNAKVSQSRATSQAQYHEMLGSQYYKEGLTKAGTTLLATGANLGLRYAGGSSSPRSSSGSDRSIPNLYKPDISYSGFGYGGI
jgi:hypothetical protein